MDFLMEQQGIKTEIQDISKCKKRMLITVPSERAEKKFVEILSEWTPKAALPGFRKGKVPRTIIEKKFSDDIRSEVIRTLLPEVYSEAIKESGVLPVSAEIMGRYTPH